jgi:ankyrin repeat protein
MVKNFFLLIVVLIIQSCKNCSDMDTPIDKADLWGSDYRLFQNTPVFELAKAVCSEDVDQVEYLVNVKKQNINFQEPKFGHSLLIMTVVNQQYGMCEKLLKLGANPNLHDYYEGTPAIVDAAQIGSLFFDDAKFLRLLLKYGANPSDKENGKLDEGNSIRYTPLIVSSGSKYDAYEKVKLLVEAGADINYKDEFNNFALKEAIILNNMEVAYYLLLHGADYRGVFIDRTKYFEGGQKAYIQDLLMEHNYSSYSRNQKYKLKIIDFLKAKGVKFPRTRSSSGK